jgi:hypothetical protein
MTFGAPEAEALYEGSAQKGFRVSILDGSPMPLGSTAINEPIGLKTLWIKKHSNTNKLISMTINDHRGTSGLGDMALWNMAIPSFLSFFFE